MIKALPALLALSLLLPLPAARADETGGGYAGFQAGMFLPIKSSVSGAFVGEDADVTYNAGFIVTGVGGYEFGNGLRGEGEFSYRQLTTDTLVNGARMVDLRSDIRTYSFMANLYYDFRTRTVISPYVGAGVGLAYADFGKATTSGRLVWSSDTDTAAAYQGIAGFTVRLCDDTSLDFAYRHFAVPRLHFKTLSAQFRGPNLSVGIRRRF